MHEAAVLGAPHELLGEAPVAFVALRPDSSGSVEEIITFCRARLASHKVPVRVVILPDLPKSSAGKIDKPLLRQAVTQPVAAP